MRVLVVGGAGYIGSHSAWMLQRGGHEVWVYDNLSEGHQSAAPPGALIVGDLMEREKLEQAFRAHKIDAVMHFAASCYVGVSVTDPAPYYQNNIVGTLSLLDAMRASGVE
ncbi:MAG: NAD-dependent epimerase/dehydratase family protein, partial [Bythopirellula sp.]